MSDDGRFVAFASDDASNLDPEGRTGVFLRDVANRTTSWIASGSWPIVSGDGSLVVFQSSKALAAGHVADGSNHLFALDRSSNTIEMIDVTPSGGDPGPYHADAREGAVSPDGRYVVFTSGSPNLVPDDTNDFVDVFVRDRLEDTTELVSLTDADQQIPAVGGTGGWSISSEGRFVAFSAWANGVVAGDANDTVDVFVRDRVAKTTEIASVSNSGEIGNRASGFATISADGQLVAFHSHATNLMSGASDAVYVRNRATGTTRLVSKTPTNSPSNGAAREPSISGDGRFVSFVGYANDFVDSDTNGQPDVFVYDFQNDSVERISVSSTGAQADAAPGNPVLSGDGRFVAWSSRASTLVEGDGDSCTETYYEWPDGYGWGPPTRSTRPANCVDIFLRDRGGATNTASAVVAAGETVSTNTTVDESDPVGTSVTSPVAGPVSIAEAQTADEAPSGYSFIAGQQINIEAPQATAANPLKLAFVLDASILPSGADASTLQVFRNGVAIADCSGASGTASPDPCVSAREQLDGGDVRLTILTSHASHWNFGLHASYPFQGLLLPASKSAQAYKAGSVLPVRFSLGADYGLGVLASGHPRSRPCGSTTSGTRTTGSLKYDTSEQQYVYIWTTDKAWSSTAGGGPCREFVLRLNDGSTHSTKVNFGR